jgi:hypothetical protein
LLLLPFFIPKRSSSYQKYKFLTKMRSLMKKNYSFEKILQTVRDVELIKKNTFFIKSENSDYLN